MHIFIVYYHPEPQSFNGAMLATASNVLKEHGHEVQVSNLYEMKFSPISGRHNFTVTKDNNFFKQQIETESPLEIGAYSLI